jgi:Skp family chaperone for outer membrane proteins
MSDSIERLLERIDRKQTKMWSEIEKSIDKLDSSNFKEHASDHAKRKEEKKIFNLVKEFIWFNEIDNGLRDRRNG